MVSDDTYTFARVAGGLWYEEGPDYPGQREVYHRAVFEDPPRFLPNPGTRGIYRMTLTDAYTRRNQAITGAHKYARPTISRRRVDPLTMDAA
jgi:hypothetical protein